MVSYISFFIVNLWLFVVKAGIYKATIYFEKIVTEEEIALKNKQIENLKNSIVRREKLLSNENYVNKAPKELVEKEKETLQKEKEELQLLLK